MSTSGINHMYNKLGLRTGAFKIYYDFFETVDGDLPSVSGSHPGYSGDVNGTINIQSGVGEFDGTNSIDVLNVDNSFDIRNWSLFFDYEKKDSEACSLFDSLETGAVPSGFQIGITESNKVYFHYYNSGDPLYYTSNNIYGNKNLVCVSKSPNSVEISYYDFNKKVFETESRIVKDKYIFYSDQFKLFENFSGSVDNFIYLDGNVSYSNRLRLCSGFLLEPNFLTGKIGVTGQVGYQTGHIDGNNKVYETGIKTFTGDLNYSSDSVRINNPANLKFFGYITDNCDINDDLYIYDGIYTGKADSNYLYPLTGFLDLKDHISGGFATPIEISGIQVTGYEEFTYPIYTGVTGIVQNKYVDYIDECGRPIFAFQDILLTGVLSGEDFIPQTGYVTTNIGSGIEFWKTGFFQIQTTVSSEKFLPDSELINSYGMEYITYIWQEDIGDFQEMVVLPERQNLTRINKPAFYDQTKRFYLVDKAYSTGELNLFVNGLLQFQDGFTISGDIFNVINHPLADFFLSGVNIRSNYFYDTGDYLVYDGDVPSTKSVGAFVYPDSLNDSGIYTGYNIYEDDLVYLNGQKMYSGLNYQISGGEWMEHISGFEDITGTLTTHKKYVGERSITGEYAKYTPIKFPRNTSIYFLNGVRLARDNYVEHSSIDLISGQNIYLVGTYNLYDNNGISGFWE